MYNMHKIYLLIIHHVARYDISDDTGEAGILELKASLTYPTNHSISDKMYDNIHR